MTLFHHADGLSCYYCLVRNEAGAPAAVDPNHEYFSQEYILCLLNRFHDDEEDGLD